jgi:DNA polymerase bacteriophage-type
MLQVAAELVHVGAIDHAAHVLHRDYETRSQATLKTVGTFKYATDPTTEVLCCGYALDDGPVQLWTPGDPIPAEFIEAATNPAWIVCAHGAHFEDAIERYVLHPRFGWPVFPIEQQRCTQAMALAMGLPARLSAAAIALELSNRKDAAGERLMHQISKPRRPHKDENPDGIYWFEDQERLDRLYAYCKQDVEIERELYGRLPPLSPAEQAIWELSTKVNARGFYVDRSFAEAARKIAQAAAPEIDAEITEITKGAVTTISQVARLLSWLREQGCGLDNLGRKIIEKQLQADDLSLQVRRALELRLGGAQAAAK